MPSDMINLGRNIRALRTANHWTIPRLARELHKHDAVDITPTIVGYLERGRRVTIPILWLRALATVFAVTTDRLLDTTTCGTCHTRPPRYFTCNVCGATQ